jgi:peptidoglycan/xylan/chitin deacetylase (PgdA/CDA1 family)
MRSRNGTDNSFTRFVSKAIALPGISSPFRFLVRNSAIVFTLHRFQDLENGNSGHSPEALRLLLGYLRKRKFSLLSIHGLLKKLRAGEAVGRVVVFTMDDGYQDQGRIGAPIFAEFDCPVTMFLTTGFLDRDQWLWWDRVEYIFHHTEKSQLTNPFSQQHLAFSCADSGERKRSCMEFVARCMDVPNDEKLLAIDRLRDEAGVSLPVDAPAKYAPLSWEDVRHCQRQGMSFAPHTVTHPVLARTTDAQSAFEISESWKRLCTEVSNPVPIFGYPNGRSQDFGFREVSLLRSMKFLGAVTAEPEYVRPTPGSQQEENNFSVPRFMMRDDLPGLIQYVDGIELLKQKLRRNEI